jgi:6-pyruvoyltetrahydropterin/6-carboxytetrahydropterin synthase
MFEVTVEAHFSSGHFLRDYYGKCENPHGHNYRVLVTLAGKELEPNGLLLDFKVLKDILKPVVNYLDHHMINELEPFTTVNPSAENLAKYFFDQTNERLGGLTGGRVWVKQSTVFETDTSQATYYAD